MNFLRRLFGKQSENRVDLFTTTVFKTNGMPEYTFVERGQIEEALDQSVSERNKLLMFLGYSKSGKTVYRKKYFSERDSVQIVYRCNRGSTWQDLYENICVEAGIPLPKSTHTRDSETDSFSASVGADSTYLQSSSTRQAGTEVGAGYPDRGVDVNHLCNRLSGRNIIIVLEDYHLVPDRFSARLSEDLKHFLDDGILFLIVGIPSSPGRTLKNNPDLGGRTQRVVFDYLLDEEVLDLIAKGEAKLKVEISSQVKKRIVEHSVHNAYLVQAICQRLLLNRNVIKTAPEKVVFRDPEQVDIACRDLAKDLSEDYDPIVALITSGQRRQKANKAYNQYEEILRSVRDAEMQELERGVTYTFIGQHTWNQFSTQKIRSRIQSGNYQDETSFKMALNNSVSQALNRLEDSFEKSSARPVLIYNENKLYLMDLVFKFFLQWMPGVISDISDESA